MSDLAQIVVLTAHLAAVGVACWGPLLAVWLEWRETRRGDLEAGDLGRELARFAEWSLLTGAGLGFVVLGLLWQFHEATYLQGLAVVPTRRLWYGLAELVFSWVCLAAYARLWVRWRNRRIWHRLLAMLGTTNALYHFPPLFAAISLASTRRELWGNGPLDHSALIRLLFHPDVVARSLHFSLASLAATAIVAAWLAHRRGIDETQVNEATTVGSRLAAWFCRIGLAAAGLTIASGIFLLARLPAYGRDRLLGGDWFDTALFLAALFAAAALVHRLAMGAIGDANPRRMRRLVWLVALVLCLMVAVRHRARAPFWERIESRTLEGASQSC